MRRQQTEGVFLPEGTFVPLLKLAIEPFLKLWEQEVFALLLAEGKITEAGVENIRSWKHSGFSVDQSVRLEADDREGNENHRVHRATPDRGDREDSPRLRLTFVHIISATE